MSEDGSHERRSRTRRTRPGPEGRISKKKKRARPVLGSIELYHFKTGEARVFHPVDANVQIKAGTYLRVPPEKMKTSKPVQTGLDNKGKSKAKEAVSQTKPHQDLPETPHQAAIANPAEQSKKPAKTDGAS